MSPEDNPNPQQFYHGTRAALKRGDLIEPGYPKTWEGRSVDDLVYFTDSAEDARIWGGGSGRNAAEKHFGVRETQRQDPVNVYVVKPTGEYEPDANFPARIDYGRIFDPGETDNEVMSWQSRHSLRVVAQHRWSPPPARSAQPVHEKTADLPRWNPDSPAYGWCHACKVSHGDPSTYAEHEQAMGPQPHSLVPWDFEGMRLPDGATFYHGTWREVGPEDVLKPGQPSNFCAQPGDFVYFTSHRGMGYTWAEDVIRARADALGEEITGLVPRVYEVQPTTPFTLDDANADNYDSEYQDYRTTGQLVVVRELPREYAPDARAPADSINFPATSPLVSASPSVETVQEPPAAQRAYTARPAARATQLEFPEPVQPTTPGAAAGGAQGRSEGGGIPRRGEAPGV